MLYFIVWKIFYAFSISDYKALAITLKWVGLWQCGIVSLLLFYCSEHHDQGRRKHLIKDLLTVSESLLWDHHGREHSSRQSQHCSSSWELNTSSTSKHGVCVERGGEEGRDWALHRLLKPQSSFAVTLSNKVIHNS